MLIAVADVRAVGQVAGVILDVDDERIDLGALDQPDQVVEPPGAEGPRVEIDGADRVGWGLQRGGGPLEPRHGFERKGVIRHHPGGRGRGREFVRPFGGLERRSLRPGLCRESGQDEGGNRHEMPWQAMGCSNQSHGAWTMVKLRWYMKVAALACLLAGTAQSRYDFLQGGINANLDPVLRRLKLRAQGHRSGGRAAKRFPRCGAEADSLIRGRLRCHRGWQGDLLQEGGGAACRPRRSIGDPPVVSGDREQRLGINSLPWLPFTATKRSPLRFTVHFIPDANRHHHRRG